LYLSIVGFAIGIAFLLVDRKLGKKTPAGFWVGLFLIVDGVLRFWLDWLRVIDRRVWVLTPTQWIVIATVGLGVYLVARGRR
jgi:prolipoprotein diacylglyceryltransferase